MFIVMSSVPLGLIVATVTVPVVVTVPVIVGAVNVLLVNICVPVSVATVESMLRVSVSPDTADVNPVPPAIWNVSPEFTAVPVESSPTKVNACDVFCASI